MRIYHLVTSSLQQPLALSVVLTDLCYVVHYKVKISVVIFTV